MLLDLTPEGGIKLAVNVRAIIDKDERDNAQKGNTIMIQSYITLSPQVKALFLWKIAALA